MKKNKVVIANWKMNMSLAEASLLAGKIAKKFAGFKKNSVAVCPNFVALTAVGKAISRSPVDLGAQDVFWENKGAYTGEISPEWLTEAGCKYAIIGHSERRKYVGENYEIINKKLRTALNTEGLQPIVCIGENWDERKTDRVDFVLAEQLQQSLAGISLVGNQSVIIAYEPIWAIGSGAAMEASEAEYSHKIIRLTLNSMFGPKVADNNFRVIYGGSISSKNVADFTKIDYIDGLLVGGASLDATEFYQIAKAIIK